MHGASSSDDPDAFGYGPAGVASRTDKDVARCTRDSADPGVQFVTVENGYPDYHCTFFGRYRNAGSIPVKVQKLEVFACTGAGCDPLSGTQLTLAGNTWVYEDGTSGPDAELQIGDVPYLECGRQMDPGYNVGSVGYLHILQGVEQDATYRFATVLTFVNWNEFDQAACEGLPDLPWPTPLPGP